MDNNLFFSNNSFEHFEDNEIDNNSLFFNQKEDNLLQSYNNDEEENNYSHINNNINNNNELMFTDSYPNINLNLKKDKCDGCYSPEAIYFCNQCLKLYCQKCDEQIHKVPFNNNHVRKLLNEISNL